MGSSTIVKVVLVSVAVIAGLYFLSNPDEINALFDDKPDVKFFDEPKISETKIPVNFSTIISVTARNYHSEGVSNVEARLSVINGENWQEHIEFVPVTELASSLSPGETTEKINIPIKAKKLSGIETPFTLQLEIYVDGESTDKYVFDLKIR